MNKEKPFVLLVEDDPDTAALYQALLMGEGMEIKRCADRRQALAFWHGAEEKPDILILDMRLPDGNGLELCKKIRSSCQDPPPVLILSAHGGPALPRQCKKAGVVAYLDKLKDMDRFVDTVKGLLDH